MSASILVVEDEAALLTLLRYNLEKQGFRVEEATDGQEALLRIAESKPDLVLPKHRAAVFVHGMTGSIFSCPSACGTPRVIFSAMSVSALPMSIWPQAMLNRRPSSDSVRVRPVTACFDIV